MLVDASEERVSSFRPPGDNGRIVASRGALPEDVVAAVITLVVSTLVLFLVALIAAASFTVIAQRRLPQLGMMSAVGATERHLRLTMLATGALTGLVASVLGAVIGLGAWIAVAPRMEGAVGFRIDALNVPRWLVVSGMLLAMATATGAAWWPARTMSRIPTVLALSGRPPRPAALDRSALLATGFVLGGVVCLAVGGKATERASALDLVLIAVGTLSVIAGVLLVSPLAIRALAKLASRVPIAARLALRDLSRYQARSGAALAAIALAVGIPVAVVAAAAAAENNLGPGNLSSSQLLVHPPELDGPFVPDADTIDGMESGVRALAATLHDPRIIRLDAATNPSAEPDAGVNGTPAISIARRVDHGWADLGLVYVASPDLLAVYGLSADDLGPNADILTNQSGDLDIMDMGRAQAGTRDRFEPLASPAGLPATFTSLPPALISVSRLTERGWQATASGRWLIHTARPISSSELAAARVIATQYGFRLESRDAPKTLANLRLGAVALGMLLALAILAMTVGLIRSESTGELRTLTATGATSSTRRTITATTAGGLAALGAMLGIAGAYIALTAGRLKDLTPLPVFDLVLIAVGTPIVATATGWLLAGREPAMLARRPIE